MPLVPDDESLTCATCGRRVVGDDVAAARLSWAHGVDGGHAAWTCDTCSRAHLRSIEGKLDPSWW